MKRVDVRLVRWHDRSACRGVDPELFFPVGVTGPAVEQIDRAKRVCVSCPVQAECLSWALAVGVDDGVWGGLTEHERRSLRRRVPAGKPPTPRRTG
jgi:WhiB family redox-sensing transcriptional regulator